MVFPSEGTLLLVTTGWWLLVLEATNATKYPTLQENDLTPKVRSAEVEKCFLISTL